MTNEYNLKDGDKVMLADDANAIGIVRFAGKESCIVDFGLGDSTTDYKDIVPLDRRTAFLTRLQLLLREFDATIQSYMSGVDTVGLCIYFGDENIEEVDYQQNDTICEITADNIMEFDKE